MAQPESHPCPITLADGQPCPGHLVYTGIPDTEQCNECGTWVTPTHITPGPGAPTAPTEPAPHPTRIVPHGCIEIPPNFTAEVELGVHPGWTFINTPGLGGEAVFFTPPSGGTPRAWSVRRERILGQPMQIDIQPTPETPG